MYTEPQKTQNCQCSPEEKEQRWSPNPPRLQTILQSYSNQDSMVLVQKKEVFCLFSHFLHTHTHTHTQEYYLGMRKNELILLVATWTNLENIILSEESQREIQISYDITYVWMLK